MLITSANASTGVNGIGSEIQAKAMQFCTYEINHHSQTM